MSNEKRDKIMNKIMRMKNVQQLQGLIMYA